MEYSSNIIEIAKRNHNIKRHYLLVNKLQGKHIPVKPSVSLEMMNTFGKQLYNKYPNANLIIGFAETATAIGAAVASHFNATYITTTREEIGAYENRICFEEEHSHAVDQMLYIDKIKSCIDSINTIILVDDELSTGKTMKNIVEAMIKVIPEIKDKKIIAASILNRMSDENIKILKDAGITCEWLIKTENVSYEDLVRSYTTTDPIVVKSKETNNIIEIVDCIGSIPDVRVGVHSKYYSTTCTEKAYNLLDDYQIDKLKYKKVAVIGTEECMYPAIIFGKRLASNKINVLTHSTTRSPISISTDDNYPIYNGYKIHSFYDKSRETFLYNLKDYDVVFVITDTKASFNTIRKAAEDVAKITHCNKLYVIRY